jgi:hypothetical protein
MGRPPLAARLGAAPRLRGDDAIAGDAVQPIAGMGRWLAGIHDRATSSAGCAAHRRHGPTLADAHGRGGPSGDPARMLNLRHIVWRRGNGPPGWGGRRARVGMGRGGPPAGRVHHGPGADDARPRPPRMAGPRPAGCPQDVTITLPLTERGASSDQPWCPKRLLRRLSSQERTSGLDRRIANDPRATASVRTPTFFAWRPSFA